MTRRRRILGAGLVLAGLLAGGAHIAAAADSPTIALVQINQQALFFTQMNEGAEKKAKEPGAKLVIFNANNDPAAQNNAIETYIAQKVDGWWSSRSTSTASCRPSSGRRSRHPGRRRRRDPARGPQMAQVGVDNEEAGKLIGEHFVEYVNGERAARRSSASSAR